MASTFSPNLRLELIGTGEQQGTWGTTTNTNLGTLLEEAIGGYVSVTVSDVADTTLTTNNGSADQSRNMVINLTGSLTGTRNVICPAIEKLYVVKNATTGSQSIVFKVSGQTGVTIPNGSTYLLYVDGTDARQITGSIAGQNANNVAITGGSITGITDLAVADGGTGASTASGARTNLGLGTISTQNSNSVSITGGTVTASASSLSILDADESNILSIAVGSNLTANTTLTLTTGATTNRTLDISASNVTVSVAGAALIDDADAAAQRTTLGLGTAATLNVGTSANNIVQLNASAQLPAVDGSLLTGIGSPAANVQTFTSTGTWTKPSGSYSIYQIQVWSAGGSGGKGAASYTSYSGGGGGGYAVFSGPISDLGSTETATIGAGGAAITTASTIGAAGGNSTFTRTNSTTITVYGGTGGLTNGAGGSGRSLLNGLAPWDGAGGNSTSRNGGNGAYGGGGGGCGTTGQFDFAAGGGASIFGGGGGGSGTNNGNAGAGGTSVYGGAGGNGGVTSGNATAGSSPGGGGGGSLTGNSGAGGNGKIIVTVW